MSNLSKNALAFPTPVSHPPVSHPPVDFALFPLPNS